MPFKLSYSFEGNYRTKPEQNLSGASQKYSRDVLLQRAHEERQKRQVKNVLHVVFIVVIVYCDCI